jgi:chromosome segregation ATPase
MNLTQQELEEKSYLEEFTTKLNSLNAQEENLQKQLEELRRKKDKVTLEMRSAAINKKLQFENCERVVKQLKDQLAGLGAEKNELDVQSEIIRQQVNNYTEMRRGLANVKLNDLKSTIKVFEREQYATDYSEIKNAQAGRRTSVSQEVRPVENRSAAQQTHSKSTGIDHNRGQSDSLINLGQNNQPNDSGPSVAQYPPTELKQSDPLDIFSELMQPSQPAQPPAEMQTNLL